MYNGVGFQSGVAYGTWRFDGVNDYIKTTDVLVSSPSQLTIGGWLRRNGANTRLGQPRLHHGSMISLWEVPAFFYCNAVKLVINLLQDNRSKYDKQLVGVRWSNRSCSASQDVWYHVISTWDGSEVKRLRRWS